MVQSEWHFAATAAVEVAAQVYVGDGVGGATAAGVMVERTGEPSGAGAEQTLPMVSKLL